RRPPPAPSHPPFPPADSHRHAPGLGSRGLLPRDLETLEFPRVLAAIAERARSAAGKRVVTELRPFDAVETADQRLALVGELRALIAEFGRPPLGDLPLLAPALAAAAPEGAALEPRRLADVRELLAAGSQVRAYLRRAPDRWPLLAAVADGIEDVPEVARPLADALDETGQVRDDASPDLRRARTLTRELRTEMEGRLMRLVRDPDMANTISETYVTLRN